MKYNNDQMIIIRQVIVYEICMCTFACCKYVYTVMIYMSFTHLYTKVGYYLDLVGRASMVFTSYFWVVTSFLGYFYFFNVMHLISINKYTIFI